ncbi:MAG: hypothetical protein KY410_05060 [Proteobacteria bacterium]|nr:hypothetical protein [Pseudomonadota bacterium]
MTETEKTWRDVSTAAENRDAALEIAQLARRQLSILTRDLEPQIYDDPDVLDAIRKLALSGSKAKVRVLLVDSTRAIKDGNRLVELSRRVSSCVEIRKPHRDYLDIAEAFMIADEKGLLFRKLATRWEGIVDPADPMQARDRLKLFNEIWQRSHGDPETRQLRI